MANLLLIESPGKLKKLSQILGNGWLVKASMGHVRELASDGEDALGFDLQGESVVCRYEPRGARGKKVLSELQQAVRQANSVYIATDPDREGETIGWHLQQALRLKNPQRVVYSEITPQAVRQAIAHPRSLDQALIAAGRARDCLDKLVGYKGSKHVVWKLNNGAKSMGRVQSATLHLICLRENEIQVFKPQDYWSVWVEYQEGFKVFYLAKFNSANSKAEEQADDATEGKLAPESDRVTSQEEADRLVAIARDNPHQVVSVEGKIAYQSPPAPFTTSTLQQAAGAKLRFSPDKTMKVAQSLYEAGHITYMRTDSVALSDQFRASVRQYLEQNDPANVPQKTASYRSTKGAQEAHEAIRPTDVKREPSQLQYQLSTEEAYLYDLIWNRAVASQCQSARLRKTRVVTQSGSVYWEARGQILEFPGYTRYWNNISADTQLPTLQQGQSLKLKAALSDKKQTQPPPRYTEPKLVQLMERKGIGRPSTYAPTIKTLKERDYVQVVKGKLQPTALGMELDNALFKLLPDLIQPEFTAQMETALDAIAHGKQDWQEYLTTWHRTYFAPALEKAGAKLKANSSFQVSFKAENSPQKSMLAEDFTDQPTSKLKSKRSSSRKLSSKGENDLPESKVASLPPAKTTKRQTQVSKIACFSCGGAMSKIPSKSTKLKADHFLKCSSPECASVMFWNPKTKKYEPPYNQRTPDVQTLSDFPCPVCSAFLERYSYTKEGKAKVMLRCSIPENRKGKCKEVAFFGVQDGFWSPKFGNLK